MARRAAAASRSSRGSTSTIRTRRTTRRRSSWRQAGGDAYDGEVAFADAQVGRLLEWLRTSGQAERTIVAVTGDHGEGLGDHGELTHGMLAYDSTLRVPLVLSLPPKGGSYRGRKRMTRRRIRAFRRTDVDAPCRSRISRARCCTPPGSPSRRACGAGPLGGGREAYAETAYPRTAGWHDLSALAFDQWKLVLSSEAELYDVTADPGETRNLASQKPALVDGARKRLAELQAAKAPAAVSAVPPEAAERLRALGYVSGAAAPPNDAAPNPAKQIAAWNTFERELTRLSDGDARGALVGLAKLARAYPDAPVFQATYARALKDTGRASQAVEIYRRLVARWPGDAALYHDLAVAATAAGMPAEAARAEQAALALQPSNAAASNGLGLMLIEQGRKAEAVAAFERAAQDDPTNATFWTNLGNARRDAGDPDAGGGGVSPRPRERLPIGRRRQRHGRAARAGQARAGGRFAGSSRRSPARRASSRRASIWDRVSGERQQGEGDRGLPPRARGRAARLAGASRGDASCSLARVSVAAREPRRFANRPSARALAANRKSKENGWPAEASQPSLLSVDSW